MLEDPPALLLAGYLDEDEVARQRKIGLRTLRSERQRGDGPPYVKVGREIFYPIEAFRDWLERKLVRPARATKRSA